MALAIAVFLLVFLRMSQIEALGNIVLIVGGPVGLGLAIWRSFIAERQTEIAQRTLISSNFSRAVELIASERVASRLGGIYTLRQIAADSEKDREAVINTLCSIIRYSAYDKEQEKRLEQVRKQETVDGKPISLIACKDVHEANKAINYFLSLDSGLKFEFDFRGIDLQYLDLEGINLTKKCPSKVDFSGANFLAAKLERANLSEARLEKANFRSADLRQAELGSTCLIEANFRSSMPIGTNFESSNLTLADFSGAILSFANFKGAKLKLAKLEKSNGLEQDQLNSAFRGPPPDSLPPDLEWPFEIRDGSWLRKKGTKFQDPRFKMVDE